MTLHTALVKTAERCSRIARYPDVIFPYAGTETEIFYIQNLELHVNIILYRLHNREQSRNALRKEKEGLQWVISYITE